MFRKGSGEQRQNSRQQLQPQQQHSQQQFSAKSLISAAWARRTRSISGTAANNNGDVAILEPAGDQYTTTTTLVNRSTPVLFSTNRGIHLRVAKSFSFATVAESTVSESITTTTSEGASASGGTGIVAVRRRNASNTASSYDIHFCDLERWSTNRANTVSLEDTITVLQPARNSIASQHSQSVDSRAGASGVGTIATGCTGTGYVPVKRCCTFTRFDVQ